MFCIISIAFLVNFQKAVNDQNSLVRLYVLFGAFRDGNTIIPVQMEIKKSSDVGGLLYLTVAMTKIKADVVGNAPGNIQAPSLLPAYKHSLAEIFRKINPMDGHFLKCLPNGFLSDEQIAAKNVAISEDNARINGYGRLNAGRDTDIEQRQSRANLRQPAPVFYSQIAMVVEGEKQEKAWYMVA